MRKLAAAPFILLVFAALFSCQKELSVDTGATATGTGTGTGLPASQTFEVKINGQLTTFNVTAATLVRSLTDNQKRVDISGTSTDNTQRLGITIGDAPALGNGLTIRDYTIRLFNDDDPNTTLDESIDTDDGFLTYTTKIAGAWVTDVYAENGILKVTASDANARTVSGTFNIKDSSLTGGPVLNFTEGKFTNIKYLVLN